MNRRQFIVLFGGIVNAWPPVARAQQATTPVVGFIHSGAPKPFGFVAAAFREGLTSTGFEIGDNVVIEYRWAQGDNDRLPELAVDLVQRGVAVIAVGGGAVLAVKAATTSIPIVFATGGDPVRDGVVASLNRPGGNLTGVTFFRGLLGAKRLELLRQLVPAAKTIAVLIHPNTPVTEAERKDVLDAAQALGQQLIIQDVTSDRDIEAAFATFVQRAASALLIGTGPFMLAHQQLLVALASRYRLPAIYSDREIVAAGGLASYAPSITDGYRQVGIYTGRILKGEKPVDLPVLQPTKFELVINRKAAKALGISIPQALLVAADEVIE
jgi:ABC-type uncharacterized transport system substrate-binding protein